MLWNEPFNIGPLRLKNRIVFPPLSTNWKTVDGVVSEAVLKFYEDAARGGCGMAVVCGTAVSPEGRGSRYSLCLWADPHVAAFRKLRDAIARHDCTAAIQLMHVGGQGNPGFTGTEPVSPSGLPCAATGFASRALLPAEVRQVRDCFVRAAGLAEEAGFPAVELHLAHGYLLHEFLSPRKNRRTDAYGGSPENRLRLILEIVDGIRTRRPNLVIGARISGEDYQEGGLGYAPNREILPELERAGVGYFSVTAGTYETSPLKHAAMARGEFFRYARQVRSIVGKPVIGVGKILDLSSAEEHLRNGDCDLVAIGRGLVADPMMVQKALRGEEPHRCTECQACQYLRRGEPELRCPLRESAHE